MPPPPQPNYMYMYILPFSHPLAQILKEIHKPYLSLSIRCIVDSNTCTSKEAYCILVNTHVDKGVNLISYWSI